MENNLKDIKHSMYLMFFSAFLLLLIKSLREYTELTEGNPGSPESCRIRIASVGHPTLFQLFSERKKKPGDYGQVSKEFTSVKRRREAQSGKDLGTS